MPRVDLQEVTKWLLAAPKIARDTAPFFWTFLDGPQDGTILLTWQPLQRLHTEMATDGYVWAGAETYYQHEVGNGLVKRPSTPTNLRQLISESDLGALSPPRRLQARKRAVHRTLPASFSSHAAQDEHPEYASGRP